MIIQLDFNSGHTESTFPPNRTAPLPGGWNSTFRSAESDLPSGEFFYEIGELTVIGFSPHLAEPEVLRDVHSNFRIRL